ncbi:uncharacterized protein LOC126882181 [Diabrotica virgifera virgifera]|uniref:Uncharacterized protein n=1 Tax=Diabrotica virgifera virgifera TaxID=50390 RepID=A0ABM5JYD9_DIAVI|nr:uncharacterized protein LOC126882181 [Diabrotica virgifera virgifera]
MWRNHVCLRERKNRFSQVEFSQVFDGLLAKKGVPPKKNDEENSLSNLLNESQPANPPHSEIQLWASSESTEPSTSGKNPNNEVSIANQFQPQQPTRPKSREHHPGSNKKQDTIANLVVKIKTDEDLDFAISKALDRRKIAQQIVDDLSSTIKESQTLNQNYKKNQQQTLEIDAELKIAEQNVQALKAQRKKLVNAKASMLPKIKRMGKLLLQDTHPYN